MKPDRDTEALQAIEAWTGRGVPVGMWLLLGLTLFVGLVVVWILTVCLLALPSSWGPGARPAERGSREGHG